MFFNLTYEFYIVWLITIQKKRKLNQIKFKKKTEKKSKERRKSKKGKKI